MRELWLEMWHDVHPDAKSKFVTKGEWYSIISFAFSITFLL